MNALIKIQGELKAPKNQRNNFGNYNYRSAEDILEAVKPLLKENECLLTITDEIVLIGDRYYVKATATLLHNDREVAHTSAFAREEETKKGMDGAQITGSASSYARKYALNGLFCIDDTKEADATNTHKKQEPAKKQTTAVEAIELIKKATDRKSLTKVWNDNKHLQDNEDFYTAMSEKSDELKKQS